MCGYRRWQWNQRIEFKSRFRLLCSLSHKCFYNVTCPAVLHPGHAFNSRIQLVEKDKSELKGNEKLLLYLSKNSRIERYWTPYWDTSWMDTTHTRKRSWRNFYSTFHLREHLFKNFKKLYAVVCLNTLRWQVILWLK